MQMAQRKRQHEREEASEQEGEDEEYSEEEEEEYFEEGEEEERSFDPEEEASETDDSRHWQRRSLYPRSPSPPPPPTPSYSPGFWFGHKHQLNIKGPAVAGRWIHAKNQVWLDGGTVNTLAKTFSCSRQSQSVQAASMG